MRATGVCQTLCVVVGVVGSIQMSQRFRFRLLIRSNRCSELTSQRAAIDTSPAVAEISYSRNVKQDPRLQVHQPTNRDVRHGRKIQSSKNPAKSRASPIFAGDGKLRVPTNHAIYHICFPRESRQDCSACEATGCAVAPVRTVSKVHKPICALAFPEMVPSGYSATHIHSRRRGWCIDISACCVCEQAGGRTQHLPRAPGYCRRRWHKHQPGRHHQRAVHGVLRLQRALDLCSSSCDCVNTDGF